MSRSIHFLCRFRFVPALIAIVACCAVSAPPSQAGSYTYGSSQRTINAGVVFNGTAQATTAMAADVSPYVFYLLNQRADAKPFGWSIINPRAPASVTGNIKNRWNAYPLGALVSPNMAAYWEVPLADVSAEQLKQYDILYLPYSVAGVVFTSENNEKLRRFVDGGGVLLVDYSAASVAPPFGLFTDAQFTTGPAALGLPAAGPLTLRHPLISRPYFLGADDILHLGIYSTSGGLTGAAAGDFSNLFAPVVTRPTDSAVSAAALGAGQIVISALNIGGAINNFSGLSGNAGPYFGRNGTSPDPAPVFAYAPAQDLKFLANVISLADIHPAESKNGHQNSAGNDLSSFASAWTYPLIPLGAPAPPPGAAVWGGYVFVTDANGTLHAFDAKPSEDLTGTGQPDDGTQDFSNGAAYDEIWSFALGGGTSAPTVGVYGGVSVVFVETSKGTVIGYNPVTGNVIQTLVPGTSSVFPGNAPAPTVYGGRVYAGQSNGSLLVYDSNSGASAGAGKLIPLVSGGTNFDTVTSAPSIGLIPDGVSNDIVALVPTQQNIYSVILGARGDILSPFPQNAPTGYDISTRFRLSNLVADKLSSPASTAFNDGGNLGGATGGKNPGFNIPAGIGTTYGNWDVDFTKSLVNPTDNLNLNQISGGSYGAVTNGGSSFTANFSPSAMDRSGDFYYSNNAGNFSYLVGVHNNLQFQNVQMKWRFRLPTISESIVDADGVNYVPYQGFQFVGAPVVDSAGYVYAVAQNPAGTRAAVFCFASNGEVYADNINGFDVNAATIQQPDEFYPSSPNQLRPGPVDTTSNYRYGQFYAVGNRATFFNFGIGAGSVQKTLVGNLTEPQPVTVIPPLDPATNSTGTPATVPLHTNLSWVTIPFAVNGGVSGLTKVGNGLFLTDGANLYKLPSSPTIGNGKLVNVVTNPVAGAKITGITITPISTPYGIGAVTAAPSAGQGTLILNGTVGISAFSQQVTLIADNNRVLEADSDGNALWAVDSTNHPIAATLGSAASVTRVSFSHPTSLSTVTTNDYLVADTGNNRCVRFDRAGDVLWELSRFTDPSGLLPPGSVLTINQPASVQLRRIPQQNGNVVEHYLVADSGNHRVIEVTDTLDPNGVLIAGGEHVLTFTTHTYDKDGRRFRYGSASYFDIPGLGLRVAALVSNTRVSLNAPGTALGPVSSDAPGGSILLFDTAVGAANGQVTNGFTSFQVAGATPLTLSMRNARFLSVYTPASASNPPFSFLYADDNGAFDLSYVGGVFTTTPGSLAFGKADYSLMTTQAIPIPTNSGIVPARDFLPFVPTCVQRIGSFNVSGVILPRYLITQSHSQGELGDPGTSLLPNRTIGGEIFEVDGVNTAVGTYSNGTLSRPGLTGPLTQPSFAIRP